MYSIYTWLVVYLPLWTIWVRQLGWWHSQYAEKMIKKCSKPPRLSTPFPKWPARGAERGHFRSKPRRCVRQRASLGPLKLHTSYVLSQGVSFAASLCRVYTVLPTVSATSVQRLRRHGNPMVSKLHWQSFGLLLLPLCTGPVLLIGQ